MEYLILELLGFSGARFLVGGPSDPIFSPLSQLFSPLGPQELDKRMTMTMTMWNSTMMTMMTATMVTSTMVTSTMVITITMVWLTTLVFSVLFSLYFLSMDYIVYGQILS